MRSDGITGDLPRPGRPEVRSLRSCVYLASGGSDMIQAPSSALVNLSVEAKSDFEVEGGGRGGRRGQRRSHAVARVKIHPPQILSFSSDFVQFILEMAKS